MNILSTPLEGVLILEPPVYKDSRGFFLETYHRNKYLKAGVEPAFVQDNLSFSVQHTLRGLHYQIRHPQAKLIQVLTGEIFDVAVDLRIGSPTFGKWTGVYLSGENQRQLFIPKGFAHGFCVSGKTAHVFYKCSDFYAPEDEGGIVWNDPDIGIDWPVKNPILSKKDRHFPCLRDLSSAQLPFAEKKT